MLDSLVRVSRRVGQVTDRFATDPEPTPERSQRAERMQSEGTDGSPSQSSTRTGDEARNRPRKDGLPRSADGPTLAGSIKPTHEAKATFSGSF